MWQTPLSSLGTQAMSRRPTRIKLVIAAFDDGDSLCLALADLVRLGFDRAQIAVAALHSSLPPKSKLGAGDVPALSEVVGILDQVETTPLVIGGKKLVATRGALWQLGGSSFDAAAVDDVVPVSWMTPQLRADLTRYIRDGAVVLGISAETFDQQRQSTRVLLKYSSHRVQTHEFKPSA